MGILGSLAPGAQLGPATLVAVGELEHGRLPVEVRIGQSRGVLEITLRDDAAPAPVVATKRYAIYWRSGDSGTNWLVAEVLVDVATALGRHLLSVEDKAPVPPGLTKFVEMKRPAPRGALAL